MSCVGQIASVERESRFWASGNSHIGEGEEKTPGNGKNANAVKRWEPSPANREGPSRGRAEEKPKDLKVLFSVPENRGPSLLKEPEFEKDGDGPRTGERVSLETANNIGIDPSLRIQETTLDLGSVRGKEAGGF